MGYRDRIAVVAEEHTLCCAGLVFLLEKCLGFSKIIPCRAFEDLMALPSDDPLVALVIVQYQLPGVEGPAGLRRVRQKWPLSHVVVVSESWERDTILMALSAGVHGFIPKSFSTSEMEQALLAVSRGDVFVPAIPIPGEAPPESGIEPAARLGRALTARQIEVLRLLAAGKSNKEIARELALSEGTVKVHINATFHILGVHNRVNAAAALKSLGLEVPPPRAVPNWPASKGTSLPRSGHSEWGSRSFN